MRLPFSSCCVAAAILAHAVDAFPQRHVKRNTTSSPCAVVSSSAAAQLAASPSAVAQVDGQLAYDCLNSVALHADQAVSLVDAILPYVQWQSDIVYLKAPPAGGYLEPSTDLLTGFAKVEANIKSGVYANEYQFMTDLWKLVNSAKDGHFRFLPDILSKALKFSRNVAIVSVSMDGGAPKIYTHNDVLLATETSFVPSAVAQINGQDVYQYLEALSQLGQQQDPDSLYNNLMFSLPFAVASKGWQGYFGGSGRYGYEYPGNSTVLTFENGTSTTFTATATLLASFSGVTDGESFYQKFCTGPQPAGAASNASPSTTASVPSATASFSTTPATGYPKPQIISSDETVSGYFLPAPNGDVAVLAMVSFEPQSPQEFQYVVQTFFAMAKAAGKKKLVIDVSANGGGYIFQGYDTFRQLFPHTVQYGYNRWREHEAFNIVSEQISALIPADYNPETASDYEINLFESPFNWRFDYSVHDTPFRNYADKFAPHEYQGDNFTAIMRWNLNDPLLTSNTTYGIGIDITGYGSRKNFSKPFDAEDIVLLYDGYCASTCTLFSEFLRLQGPVRSIALGGRHTNTGAMQGVGGVKGANNYAYGDILNVVQTVYQSGNASQQAEWSVLTTYSDLPISRSTDTSLNVRDDILPADRTDGVPAQFVIEEADCRLFYTPNMITDMNAIWSAAADAAWGAGKCAAGKGFGGQKRRAVTEEDEGEELAVVEDFELVPRSFPVKRADDPVALVRGRRSMAGKFPCSGVRDPATNTKKYY